MSEDSRIRLEGLEEGTKEKQEDYPNEELSSIRIFEERQHVWLWWGIVDSEMSELYEVTTSDEECQNLPRRSEEHRAH